MARAATGDDAEAAQRKAKVPREEERGREMAKAQRTARKIMEANMRWFYKSILRASERLIISNACIFNRALSLSLAIYKPTPSRRTYFCVRAWADVFVLSFPPPVTITSRVMAKILTFPFV
jgi:hypothetical protein